jgi:hypothetical protein
MYAVGCPAKRKRAMLRSNSPRDSRTVRRIVAAGSLAACRQHRSRAPAFSPPDNLEHAHPSKTSGPGAEPQHRNHSPHHVRGVRGAQPPASGIQHTKGVRPALRSCQLTYGAMGFVQFTLNQHRWR